MGKGSKQRPRQISKSQFDANFDAIFGKKEGARQPGEPQKEKGINLPRKTELSDSKP